ncbi:MAG: hypothetical protein ACNI3A_11785 [Desulfovibrio sp.]|uniref:hypothetical protein n=1 Tax=Desulfovibrio sp. 7SRBS1 TaxID=3378064 RepID=UPI003B3DFADC
MFTPVSSSDCLGEFELSKYGLDTTLIANAINHTHGVLESLDVQLMQNKVPRMSQLFELANLSAMVGNLFRGGVVIHSGERFVENGPHKFPDILGNRQGCSDIEIKVALENNKPKGHLVKPGPHLICRYVLANENGSFERGKENRGVVARIWEVRVGHLLAEHFNESNTPGDSGKTAVINADGMNALTIVYCNLNLAPLSPNGRIYKDVSALFD